MRYEHRKMECSLLFILDAFGETWTTSEAEEVSHFVNHGEYGVALETLCAIIEEENKGISSELYRHIQELGKRMELDPETWDRVKSYVIDQGEPGRC